MTSPLNGPIKKIIGKALSPIMLNLTYTDIDVQPRPTPAIETSYSCKGYVASLSDFHRLTRHGSQMPDDTRVVVILAHTLDVTPKQGDKITTATETLLIDRAEVDPAGATWTLTTHPTPTA